MKKQSWQSIRDTVEAFCAEHPLRLTTIIVLCISLIAVPFTFGYGFYDRDFLKGLLENVHVLIFDLIVVGIISLFFNSLGERQKTIKRYWEEIEDYLGWEADEAKYRIVGNIKRLNRLGVTDINLEGAYLKLAHLSGVHLEGADMEGVHLEGADLGGSHLVSADLGGAHLEDADLLSVHLEGADLTYAYLEGASLWGAHLRGARLDFAHLRGAKLVFAHLEGAELGGASLEGAHLRGASLEYTHLEGAVLGVLIWGVPIWKMLT